MNTSRYTQICRKTAFCFYFNFVHKCRNFIWFSLKKLIKAWNCSGSVTEQDKCIQWHSGITLSDCKPSLSERRQRGGDIWRQSATNEIHHSVTPPCPRASTPSIINGDLVPHPVVVWRSGGRAAAPLIGLWFLYPQRFPGMTPARTCPRSRTAGRPRPTWLWCEELGSPTSATPVTTWWGGRPWPASWTCPGARSRRSAKRVSSASGFIFGTFCSEPDNSTETSTRNRQFDTVRSQLNKKNRVIQREELPWLID